MKILKIMYASLFIMSGCYTSDHNKIDKSSQLPALRKAIEFVDLINAHDKNQVRNYHSEQNFETEFLAIMKDNIDFVIDVFNGSGGFIIESIDESLPTTASLILVSKLTDDRYILSVVIDDATKSLITGLQFIPQEEICLGRLDEKQVVRELDVYLDKLIRVDKFSGTVLIAKHGKPFYIRACGDANKDFNIPNTIETKFNIASVGKMFTAVAIAQLVEQGKLSFEDPLDKFLPAFPNAQDAKKIKVKHLLSHTSGLGNYFTQKNLDKNSYELFRTIDSSLILADDTAVKFEPGTEWSYSNTGYLILGKIIELVSGQSYFDYIRQHVAEPAGMLHTDFYEMDKVNVNLATGYSHELTDHGYIYRNNIFSNSVRGSADGGGYSTVNDLLKFDQALRNNILISQSMKEQLTTAKPELNSPNYGYGFTVESSIVGHNGAVSGARSVLEMYQNSEEYTVAILANYDGMGLDLVGAKIKHLLKCLQY